MTAVSAALACCPAAKVLTRVAIFSAICVSTGRSCKAVLIHCALHPVAARAIASARASKVLDLELVFIVSPLEVVKRFVLLSFVVGRWPRSIVQAHDPRPTIHDGSNEILRRLSSRCRASTRAFVRRASARRPDGD